MPAAADIYRDVGNGAPAGGLRSAAVPTPEDARKKTATTQRPWKPLSGPVRADFSAPMGSRPPETGADPGALPGELEDAARRRGPFRSG